MILKFDLKLVVVDLMFHCWMWSKLNCFSTSVVNLDMSEKQRKLCQIFYKGFNVKKIIIIISHHVSEDFNGKHNCINGFAPRILF